jgi:hypothetical protein
MQSGGQGLLLGRHAATTSAEAHPVIDVERTGRKVGLDGIDLRCQQLVVASES